MITPSKSQLAKLMAAENITVEQRKVETAYFDLKGRVLVIPTFKDDISPDLYDLFIGHEVSHALNTPPEGWHNATIDLKIPKSVVNVCEDARIEKKIKRKFPGMKMAFTKGYREILDMDFFGLGDTDPNTLNLIDRINLECKCGIYFKLPFTDEERALLVKVENAETFDDVIVVSQEIVEYMKLNPQEDEIDIVFKYGDNFELTMDEYFGDIGDMESIEIDKAELPPRNEKSNQMPSSGSGDVDDEPDSDDGNTLGAGDKLESKTDNAFRDREKSLYGKTEYDYVDIPDLNLDKIIVGHKELYSHISISKQNWQGLDLTQFTEELDVELNSFRKSSGKTVSYLVKEFELRKNASQMAKASISKTGDLNMKKIYSYNFTDDIFKRLTIVPNGKSHGLVLFLDWSGSMSNSIHETIKQLLTLVFFCKKVNIPYEVYAFSTGYPNDGKNFNLGYKHGDIMFAEGTKLLNIISSKMNASQFRYATQYLFSYQNRNLCNWNVPGMGLSGTPLNETILCAMKILPKFQKDNKLDIVNTVFLTDGDGHTLHNVYQVVNHEAGELKTSRSINYSATIIFRDPKNKETASFKYKHNHVNTEQTMSLLKLLKLRTGCNITGFYIMPRGSFRSAYKSYKGNTEDIIMDKYAKVFNKVGSYTITDVGYDEYHFLRNDRLEIEDDDGFGDKVVNTTSTKTLVSAFYNYSKNKLNNKLVLNRFISMIA